MLTDKHTHAAQKLINKDFPDIVQQTPALSQERFYELTTDLRVKTVIQIHNNGNEYWVVSTNNEDKAVFVYDSLYNSINTETLKQIDQVYSMVPLCKRIKTKQTGGVDCGLFAIAYLVDICYGRDPSMIIYDQSKMLEHLKECFEKQRMTGFPRFRVDTSCAETNKLHESWEWELPKKTVKRMKFTERSLMAVTLLREFP